MKQMNYFFIISMFLNVAIATLIYQHFGVDSVLSWSIIFNLIISYFLCIRCSLDDNPIKLVFIYLVGFTLFICGRFIANVFGVSDVFCIEFGFVYCLSDLEKIKSFLLINCALIAFLFGFINNKTKRADNKNEIVLKYPNTLVLFFLSIVGVFLGGISLYNSYKLILSAINNGYLSIFSEQDGLYSTPLTLVAFTFFVAIMAIQYTYKSRIKFSLWFFRVSVLLYIVIMISSVLQGSRSGFITGLLFGLWLYLDKKKLNFRLVLVGIGIFFLIFIVNDLASLSGARDAANDNGLAKFLLEDVLYNQGITMMVFNMGMLNDGYPILAYLKVLFPGIQIIYGWFDTVYNYNLTFSSNLLYRLAPSVFAQGFGLGWSLLGEFYAFSFSFIPLFMLLNYGWGKLLFLISSRINYNQFFSGLFICFLTQIFMISRGSVSNLWALVIFYCIVYLLVTVRLKK